MDGEKIVKCACGLPMRQKNWRDHWYSCRVGSPVPVTPKDEQDLRDYEQRRRDQDLEHQRWLQGMAAVRNHRMGVTA